MWNKLMTLFLLMAFLSIGATPLQNIKFQSDQEISIDSPEKADVITGKVNIIGTNDIPGFLRYDVAFSYGSETAETWFQINESLIRIRSGIIAVWDTTQITDGDYRIRLRVFTDDNATYEYMVSSVSVRNYTPIITLSPTPMNLIGTISTLTSTPTITPVVIPTGLPENSLVLTSGKLAISLIYGILAILIIVLIIVYTAH